MDFVASAPRALRDRRIVAGREEWTSDFSQKDWAAADSSRRERWPGDAPIDFHSLAQLSIPKVLVAGAWRPEIAPVT